MAKSEKQKLKLLYIYQILNEETDRDHCITTQSLISRLAAEGINAERKSIYSDIQYLTEYGYDIKLNSSKTKGGYYLASREFDLPILKLLVDAVVASKFISVNKSKEVIRKLEKLAGTHQAKELQRQVYVADRVKTQNESVLTNTDEIHRALNEHKKVSFQYFEWNVEKQTSLKKNGQTYCVNPVALTVNAENYYLIAYNESDGIMKHYRVDKMLNVKITDIAVVTTEELQHFDLTNYMGKTFGMYGGDETMITILFPNRLIGVVIDRFGQDIDVRRRNSEQFSIRIKVAMSNQLYGWLAGLGKGVQILLPESEANKYTEYLQELLASQQKIDS